MEFDTRVPPHDTTAEQSCLGAAILDKAALEAVAESLSGPEDFHQPRHQRIWEAILALRPGTVDMVTVGDELKRRGWLESVGGLTYLSQLWGHVTTTGNAGAYAEIVAHKARCRRAQQRLREQVERLYGAAPDDLEDIGFMASLAVEGSPLGEYPDVRLLGDVAVERVAAMRERKRGELLGTTWGFKRLDYATPGLEPMGLYIIAGRPGVGKTGFALDVCRRNAKETRKPWLFATFEMAVEALADRQLTALAMVDGSAYRRAMLNPQQWEAVHRAAQTLKEIPLYATGDCVTLQDVRRRALYVKTAHKGIAGVMVDYLQLIAGTRRRGQSREEFVSEISRGLKLLARELNAPVVALSQLNRAVEARPDKRPQLSDLRESGSLEQDAEAVLLLFRQDYYDDLKGAERTAPGVVEVIIAKQRNMPVGTVKLHFQDEWGLWTDLERQREGA